MAAGGVQAFGRGLVMRCPTCGQRGIFASFFTLRERCPGCGTAFEREEGYFLGAMIILIGVTEALFGIWFVAGMLLTWPDVPWTTLLIGGVVLNLTFPIIGYPWSKTAWMGLHDAFVPEEPAQQADAITALDAQRREAALAARDERDHERDHAGGHARDDERDADRDTAAGNPGSGTRSADDHRA